MKKATIYIYDTIGDGLLTANNFRQQLLDLESQGADEFDIHINSYGGDVFEGMAIYNLLKSRNVTTYIDGLAASIASVIALAGKKIIMYKNTMLMIHNAWALTAGDGNKMKKQAGQLDQVNELIVKVYTDKTGLSKNEIISMMDSETFLNAQTAKAKGFVDQIQDAAQIKNEKEFIGFYASINKSQIKKDIQMNPEQMKALCKSLGIKEDSTADEIINHVNQVTKQFNDNENLTKVSAQLIAALKVVTPNKEGTTTDPAILAVNDSVAKLTNTVEGLVIKLDASADDKAESIFNQGVNDKKLLPSQKDLLVGSKEKPGTYFRNADGLKKFVDTLPVLQINQQITLPKDQAGKPLTYENLLKDMKAYNEMKQNNPAAFNALRDEWFKNPSAPAEEKK